MPIQSHIIVNADDLGLRESVNKAILYCYENEYINSTSLLTNLSGFQETIDFVHEHPAIINIGAHINFAQGKPLTKFKHREFIDEDGGWNLAKTGANYNRLTEEVKRSFNEEINLQIEKALSAKIKFNHIDSHLHLHTLPAFYPLFIEAAKRYKLKLRLAQTYREGSYLKYYYRRYLNSVIKKNKLAYSNLFETAYEFFKHDNRALGKNVVEIMVHPDFDANGILIDTLDPVFMENRVLDLHTKYSF